MRTCLPTSVSSPRRLCARISEVRWRDGEHSQHSVSSHTRAARRQPHKRALLTIPQEQRHRLHARRRAASGATPPRPYCSTPRPAGRRGWLHFRSPPPPGSSAQYGTTSSALGVPRAGRSDARPLVRAHLCHNRWSGHRLRTEAERRTMSNVDVHLRELEVGRRDRVPVDVERG